jgi:electron transport complex protein RnfG
MTTLVETMKRTAIVLAVAAVFGSGLVALSFEITRERIAINERAILLRSLNVLVAPEQRDNDLYADSRQVQDETLLGTANPVTVYRARKNGQPVAAVLTPVAPDGYNGTIRLLVGIDYQGTLVGVRVVSHQETPGLGDKIEERRSPWILSFTGRSLDNPSEAGWNVKRDGGIFDQFTGATITPRAVVKAIRRTLLFYQQHREEIFAQP